MAMEKLAVNGTTEILKMISSFAAQEIWLFWGVEKEVEKLQHTFAMIQAVLHDAEKRQIDEEAVRFWLARLKDVAYDAEDLLGVLATEYHLRQQHKNRMKSKVRDFFSLSNPLAFRLKIAHKVDKINRRLEDIGKERVTYGFRVQVLNTKSSGKGITEDRETFSFVDDSRVFGRENDKSKIVDMLLKINSTATTTTTVPETLSVISIVGMGGLGKTTLSQLVYNDELISSHFNIKSWVCVSDYFDVKRLLKEIIVSITKGESCDLPSLELLSKRLQEILSGKRFLLVLDDVWSEEVGKWEKLKDSLRGGVKGSAVIVTTRSHKIAEMMGTQPVYNLEILPDDECWIIFEQRAFGNRGGATAAAEKTPNLVEIGRAIVRKCKGVPLAAKSLGGLLHSETEECKWRSILDSKLWNLPEDPSGILPALKLSYDHLSPPLKQCFSYCALFPKDYKIGKEKLIQLWLAEGFLQKSKESDILEEDIGNEYFKTLLRNSFFQDVEEDDYGNTTTCKMHDLVHDLAQTVRGFENSTSEVGKPWSVSVDNASRIRRFSSVTLDVERYNRVLKELVKAKKLRTFLHPHPYFGRICMKHLHSIFMNLKHLRVLDLSCTNIQMLSPSISKLKQVRYLNLSWTYIKVLPDSITTLYNLQTLKLKNCMYLGKLPKNMRRLINLRHLEIDSTVKTSIGNIGQLRCLQMLPVFRVGQDKGCGISELEHLNLLRGELEICNLENVRERREEASKANLKGKPNIHKLGLHWVVNTDGGDRTNIDEDVLEGLQPHPNLKSLSINGFQGGRVSKWMMSSLPSNLVKIILCNCHRLEYVPALGHLRLLKHLTLRGLVAVKCLDREFYQASNTPTFAGSSSEAFEAFPLLEVFTISHMHNLEKWLEVPFPSFRCLKNLSIDSCSNLTVLPNLFPPLEKLTDLKIIDTNLEFLPEGFIQNNNLLQSLRIYVCNALTSLPDLGGLQSLQELAISYCGKLMCLPEGMQCLTNLQKLEIGGFSEEFKDSFPMIAEDDVCQHLVSLRTLRIRGWSTLHSLPEQLRNLTALNSLDIWGFDSMVALPDWLGNIASLQYLKVRHCKKLVYLPEEMQRLTNLQSLRIHQCPLLYEKKDEEDYKVKHIPNIFWCP